MPHLTTSQLLELLARDKECWSLVTQNFKALDSVQTKQILIDDFAITVQYNPARIVSSGAKTDAKSIKDRPCFLCEKNRPKEQDSLPFLDCYQLLVNPYPIFKQHFTVIERTHVAQQIKGRFNDFLELARQLSDFTVLYNGPQCGASAPDHMHFQVVTRGQMPMDTEIETLVEKRADLLAETSSGQLFALVGYLRDVFVIKSTTMEQAKTYFSQLYEVLNDNPELSEPMMNIIGFFMNDHWTIVVIPRLKHRPWQYEALGGERVLTAPGAADMGGLFITVRPEDFAKMNESLLQNIYVQISINGEKMKKCSETIKKMNK